MKSLEVFMRSQHFDKKKRLAVYNEYNTFCEELHIPKTKRAKRQELFAFVLSRGYKFKHEETGNYFIKEQKK